LESVLVRPLACPLRARSHGHPQQTPVSSGQTKAAAISAAAFHGTTRTTFASRGSVVVHLAAVEIDI